MEKFTRKIESSNSDDDSAEDLPEVDNKYTSSEKSEEEKEAHSSQEEESHQQLNGKDIGEKTKKKANPAPKKSYRGIYGAAPLQQEDEPYGCPYGACGRKFVSAGQLKEHVERRHVPKQNRQPEKKPEPQVENDIIMIDTTASGQRQMLADQNMEVSTPLHPKMQKPKQFEEDKRPGTSGANMYFKAAPRPITSHGRGNQQSMSTMQQQILKDIMGKNMVRPQTAATSTKKDEERIKKQMMFLEGIEDKIERDLELFDEQRAGGKKQKEKKGVRVTREMLLEGSQCDELNQIQRPTKKQKIIQIINY